ncbi:MAG: hypothetical protein ACXWLY_31630, partial [Thermoanaerobaculia bacterium]
MLFGDGAGAAIVSRGPRVACILGAVAGTDGSQAGILGIQGPGKVVMNGKEVFREAVRRMSATSREVLASFGAGFHWAAMVLRWASQASPHFSQRERIGSQSVIPSGGGG